MKKSFEMMAYDITECIDESQNEILVDPTIV